MNGIKVSSRAGREIFHITPLILGGSPTDPANRVLLDRRQHIEAVRYWNRVIRDLRRGPQKG
jgi:hypothetical protein